MNSSSFASFSIGVIVPISVHFSFYVFGFNAHPIGTMREIRAVSFIPTNWGGRCLILDDHQLRLEKKKEEASSKMHLGFKSQSGIGSLKGVSDENDLL